MWSMIKEWIPALKSRKVRVSVTTFIVAAAAKLGFDLPAELVYSIVVLGVAIVGGIAIEDAGVKSGKRTVLTAGIEEAQVKGNGSKTG